MDADRLNKLKLRAERATSLAEQLEKLGEAKHEADSHKLDWAMRCDIYRLGREALIKQKEAELEELLSEPKSVEEIPPPATFILPTVITQPTAVDPDYRCTNTPEPQPFAEISC